MKIRWLEDRIVKTPQQQDVFKVGTSGISVQITQRNSKTFLASFYLRILPNDNGRETLGDRLNDPAVNFLPCKIDERTELLNLSMLSHIRTFGELPEVEMKEQLGAIRQPARVTMDSGYTFCGDFIYIQPSARARLSDLLNFSTERFLLFQTPSASLYLYRDAIVRLVP
jgi:hypothetical protein